MIGKIKKIPLFWKIYIIIVTLVLVGFVVVWTMLWSSLKEYEQSRPEYAISNVISQIESQDTDEFIKYVETNETAFEGEAVLEQAVKDYTKDTFAEGEWTFTKKSGEYTNERPAYQLKKDGKKTDLVVYFTRQQDNKKKKWVLDGISGLKCMGESYTIVVPENSKVMIDGNILGSEYAVETKDAEVLSNVAKYIKMPQTTTYIVDSVYCEHSINAKGPVYDNELELISSSDNQYVYGFEADKKLISEQESRIIDITKIYSRYVVNYEGFSKLSSYILPGSYAYSYLSKISSTNRWLEVSKEPEFSDMKVFNYQSYTKDCFSCEISFNEKVTYDNGNVQEYPTHIEYIFVKRSGRWYIADMVLHK